MWILWTYCLMKANHKKDHKQVVGFQEIVLQPGQFIFGRKKAAEETGLSERNVRTCLLFLKKYKNLTIKATNKFSIVSIINWDTYQKNDCATDQQSDQQVTSNRPASDQQVTTNKNKRTKEQKKKEELFARFWEMYGNKVDRKKCLSKFKRLKQSDIDLIFKNLPSYIQNTPDIQFRKNPLTYLNSESWNDEAKINGGKNGKSYFKTKNYTSTPEEDIYFMRGEDMPSTR